MVTFPGTSGNLPAEQTVTLAEIGTKPGTATDNAFIESFNARLRDECLNVHWFDDLMDAKEKLQENCAVLDCKKRHPFSIAIDTVHSLGAKAN